MKAVYSLATAAIVALSFDASAASTFRLSSADIPANLQLTQKQVFKGFGCSGDNISPQLSWKIRQLMPKVLPLRCLILMRQREAAGGTGPS